MDLNSVWKKLETKYKYLREIRPFMRAHMFPFYEQLFESVGPVRNLLELGVFKGGSLVLWYEALGAHKIVGVDLAPKPPQARHLSSYMEAQSVPPPIKCYWQTNQTDSEQLRKIVANEFEGPLDIIIDDASHVYSLTRASFMTLFPLLAGGGYYIIEDWPTDYMEEFHDPAGTMKDLFKEITDLIGREQFCVAEITVNINCAVVRKARRTNGA